MKFTEAQLQAFSAPLSETENQKCQNAINMVRDALIPLGFNSEGRTVSPMYADTYSYSIRMVNKAKGREIKIFVQGSYANNTNVRTQSDVDIAIVQEDTFNSEVRQGVSKSQYGLIDVPEPPQSFKDEVQAYLKATFGSDVIRKNKSIKISGNTYRKDTDTVPCRRFRDYRNNYTFSSDSYVGGIRIVADDGSVIINYPEQHIANGRAKNTATNYYYKRMVRVFKKLRYLMLDSGQKAADNVSSFGLESLLWNLPDNLYINLAALGNITKRLLDYLTRNSYLIGNYYEANGIKLLCSSQFEVDQYNSFIKALTDFFEYI